MGTEKKQRKTNLIDSSLIISFLIKDHNYNSNKPYESMHGAAKELFRQIESGEYIATLELPVLMEAIYVLESYYKQKRGNINLALQKILDLRHISIKEKDIIKDTLWLWAYSPRISFIKCYLFTKCKSKKLYQIDSLDRNYDIHNEVEKEREMLDELNYLESKGPLSLKEREIYDAIKSIKLKNF